MKNKISLEITTDELNYIYEALELFLRVKDPIVYREKSENEKIELASIESFFKRIEDKVCELNGEPEEGY
jgi:hypothetical protein